MTDKSYLVFISLPMKGRTEEDVLKEMLDVFEKLEKRFPNISFAFVDSYHKAIPSDISETRKEGAWIITHSLKLMAMSDLVIFAGGWASAKGCIVEKDICSKYNIPYIDETQIDLIEEEDLLKIMEGE